MSYYCTLCKKTIQSKEEFDSHFKSHQSNSIRARLFKPVDKNVVYCNYCFVLIIDDHGNRLQHTKSCVKDKDVDDKHFVLSQIFEKQCETLTSTYQNTIATNSSDKDFRTLFEVVPEEHSEKTKEVSNISHAPNTGKRTRDNFESE